MPHDAYEAGMQTMVDAILTTPGETDTALRRAIKERASELGGLALEKLAPVPDAPASYVDKVALYAYKVTDEDIEALRRVGYSEDAIFEITLSAALGAGVARLEYGLKALEEGQL
jgi:alkylhydroperoxidase family enzyme